MVLAKVASTGSSRTTLAITKNKCYKNVGDPEQDIFRNLECEKIKKTFQAMMKDRKRNLSKPPRRPRHT
jgi:hypothetical protein